MCSAAQDLKMYLCWNSTSESSSTRVTQSVEISKQAGIDNAHAGSMMFTPKCFLESFLQRTVSRRIICEQVLVLCVGVMVLLVLRANPLNMVPNSFQTPTLLDPKGPGQPGKPHGPQRATPKPSPASSTESKRPPKAKTSEQQAKGVTWYH